MIEPYISFEHISYRFKRKHGTMADANTTAYVPKGKGLTLRSFASKVLDMLEADDGRSNSVFTIDDAMAYFSNLEAFHFYHLERFQQLLGAVDDISREDLEALLHDSIPAVARKIY